MYHTLYMVLMLVLNNSNVKIERGETESIGNFIVPVVVTNIT